MQNLPPLPQPAPHTCPNCGAALAELPDFCPQCGAPLKARTARAPLSLEATIFLALGLLVFGAIGSCGGLFIAPIFSTSEPHGRDLITALLVLSAPALLIGIVGFVLCLRALIHGAKR